MKNIDYNKRMESFYEIFWNYKITDNMLKCLAAGSIPKSMEDKWYIYIKDNSVFFYRSWTGICVYELILNPFINRHIVRININPDEYKPDKIEKELKKLECIINNMEDQYKLFLIETSNSINNNEVKNNGSM